MLSSPHVSPPFGVLSEGTEHFFQADRRQAKISELEVAATILRRATCYLIEEQMAERCTSVYANRDAIRLLCYAGRQIASNERRAPAQRSIRAWLQNILFEPKIT